MVYIEFEKEIRGDIVIGMFWVGEIRIYWLRNEFGVVNKILDDN